MQELCLDADGITSWFYDESTRKYIRQAEDGQNISRIGGEYLPNPDLFWQKRCEVRGVATTSIEGMSLKPSDCVYYLFNHWQKVKNADTNN